MALLRSLIYIGFIVAVIASWYFNKKKNSRKTLHTPEQTRTLDTPEAIAAARKDPHWKIRLMAVQAHHTIDDPDRLQSLLDMLDDPVLAVREAAADGIQQYGDDAVAGLATVLKTGKLNAREMAVKTLCDIGSVATVDILANALYEDESDWVRIPAAIGLQQLGGDQATSVLTQALSDANQDVVRAAEAAIYKDGIATAPVNSGAGHTKRTNTLRLIAENKQD